MHLIQEHIAVSIFTGSEVSVLHNLSFVLFTVTNFKRYTEVNKTITLCGIEIKLLPERNDYTVLFTIAKVPKTKHQMTQHLTDSLKIHYINFLPPKLQIPQKENHTYAPPQDFQHCTTSKQKSNAKHTSHPIPALTPMYCSTALQSCGPQLLFLQILILQHEYFKILVSVQEQPGRFCATAHLDPIFVCVLKS